MAIKIRKGLEANRTSITPEEGELLYTTDEKKLYLGDGTTAGGLFPVLDDVKLTGDQDVEGVKTFSDATIIPNSLGVSSDGCVFYNPLSRDFIDIPNNTSLSGNPNDEVEGTLTNFTRNDGTVSGGVTIDDGAMVFDGVDDWVSAGAINIFGGSATQFSSSVWVKHDNGGFHYAKRREFQQVYNSDTKLITTRLSNISTDASTFTASFTEDLNDGNWHNIVATWNGDGDQYIRIYHNGVYRGISSLQMDVLWQDTNTFFIGRQHGGFYMDGSINNVKLFNRALSTDEITEIYNAGRNSYSPIGDGLIGQWSGKENDYAGTEASPTTIYDTKMVVKGPFDEALNFNGVDDYVEFTTPIVTNITSVSISAWIKADDLSSVASIGGQITNLYETTSTRRGAWLFGINGLGKFQTRYYPSVASSANDFVESSTVANLGEYYYIVFTNDGGTGKLYVNGILESTNTEMDDMWSNEIQRINRARSGASYSYLGGSISQPLIFNKALTENEIKAIYNRQRTYFTDNNPAGRLGDVNVKGDLGVIGTSLITNDGTGDGLFIDQNGNGIGLEIDQDGDNYGFRLTTTNTNAEDAFWIADDSASTQVRLLRDRTSTTGTNFFYRNLASASTAAPVMFIEQDHASDNQNALSIQQDGTGNGLFIDQNGDGIGLEIDSEATSRPAIAVDGINTGTNGGNNENIYRYAQYIRNAGNGGNLLLYREVATAVTPIFYIVEDHASSTINAAHIRNDGTGNGVFIDQDGNGIGLEIDSEATTASNYGLIVNSTTSGARITQSSTLGGLTNYFEPIYPTLNLERGSSSRGATLSIGNTNGKNHIYSASTQFGFYDKDLVLWFTYSSGTQDLTISRNIDSAATDAPLVKILNDNAGDDQPALEIQQDGTGAGINLAGGAIVGAEVDNGNSSTADTIAWNAGNIQKSTLTGNCTYTFTAPSNDGTFMLKLVQDATGSRTVTWPASVKWPGGTAPTLSTAANAIDIITFMYDGTSYYGVDSLNFS